MQWIANLLASYLDRLLCVIQRRAGDIPLRTSIFLTVVSGGELASREPF